MLSSADYTIYANGKTDVEGGDFDLVYPLGCVYTQYPGQKSPNELWGTISTWTDIDYKGRFFRAKGGEGGNNANAFSTTVDGNVQAEGLPNITGETFWYREGGFLENSSGFTTGAFTTGRQMPYCIQGSGASAAKSLAFNASLSNAIYGASSHVITRNQTIIVWKRKA